MSVTSIRNIQEMTPEHLADFLANVRESKTDRMNKRVTSPRRQSAQARIDIAKNEFAHLVYSRIDEVWETYSVRKEIKAHAKMSMINPLNNITKGITTAYNVPPTRTLKDQSEEINKKFAALLEEGMITIGAKQWLTLSFISNTIIVVPTIRELPLGRKLVWDMHLPNTTEVITEEGDPLQVAIMGTVFGDQVCVLDNEAWWYFDEDDNIVNKIEHNLGIFPGTTFRIAPPMESYWDPTRNNNVVFGTIELARIWAEMSWIRKAQSRKIPVIIAQSLEDDVPAGQVFHPEQPFEAQTDNPENFKFTIEDMVTSVDEFQKHISIIYHELAESFGIDSSAIDFDSSVQGAENTVGLGQAQQHARLAEIREDHIQWLRVAEKDLTWKTALMAQRFNHPNSVDPSIVKDNYEVVWGPLMFVDHPQIRTQVQAERIKLGVMSPVDVVLADHPDWTREMAMKWIEQITEEKRAIAEFHAANNLPTDQVEANMTVAERQGQEGGFQRAENEEEEDDS